MLFLVASSGREEDEGEEAAVTPNSRGSDAWQQTAGVSAEAVGEGDCVAIRRTMQRQGDDGNDVPAEER